MKAYLKDLANQIMKPLAIAGASILPGPFNRKRWFGAIV